MKRLTLVSVIVPLLGFLALVGRAEYARRHGPTWRIPISGYDPRDLIHGHYLRYEYRFRWQGEHTCGPQGPEDAPRLDPGCCLCLDRTDPQGIDPPVRQISCGEEIDPCDAVVRADAVMPPLRHFVPEERAGELERAIVERRAELELTIGPDQSPAVRELWLDGRPWREQLGE